MRSEERFMKFWLMAIGIGLVCLAGCSSDPKVSGGTEDHGIVALVDKDIVGVSQKGPFIKGSSISLYSLNENFAQTGMSFSGKILSDNGEFSFQKISTPSQYASLVANGYYRNEITGELSEGPISLYAISDLSGRDSVNINLLTHLEYECVFSLLNKGIPFEEAKKTAKGNVLSSFYITGNFSGSEEMNILENGESNGVLLAISVLLQRDLNAAKLTQELQEISGAIALDGEWANNSIEAEIADWAEGANLSKIRRNILAWKLGDDLPDFEKYVNHYWWKVYKLPDCTAKNNGDTARASNKLSANDGRDFICTDNNWKKILLPGEGKRTVQLEKGVLWVPAYKDKIRPLVFDGDEDGIYDLEEGFGGWISFDDKDNGGNSEISVKYGIDNMEISFKVFYGNWVSVGSGNQPSPYPFVGFGFDLDNSVRETDVSDYEGICLQYSLSKTIRLQLTSGTNYWYQILKSTGGEIKAANIKFLDFRNGWKVNEMTISEGLRNAGTFHFTAPTDDTLGESHYVHCYEEKVENCQNTMVNISLQIYKVGLYGMCE